MQWSYWPKPWQRAYTTHCNASRRPQWRRRRYSEIAMERDIGRNVDREVQSSSSQSDICRSRGNRRLETVKYSRSGLPCDFLPRGRRWGSKYGISHKIWEISMAKVLTICWNLARQPSPVLKCLTTNLSRDTKNSSVVSLIRKHLWQSTHH